MPLQIVGTEKYRFTKSELKRAMNMGLDLCNVKTRDQLLRSELDFINTLDMTPEGQQLLIKLANYIEDTMPSEEKESWVGP